MTTLHAIAPTRTLAHLVREQWAADGYGIPGAVPHAGGLQVPVYRPNGETLDLPIWLWMTTSALGEPVYHAEVNDAQVLDALAYIDRVDGAARITGHFPALTWEPGRDTADGTTTRKLEAFRFSRFDKFSRDVWDLWRCAERALAYSDGYGAWDTRSERLRVNA